VLSKGQATKDEIVAGTGLSPTTTQNLLVSLVRAEQIVRVGIARYALPAEGLAGHVSTEAAIFDVLSAGPTSPAELRARTGKGAGEIAGGLHRLKKAGKIILTKRGMYSLYSLASTGARHVYAKEAIDDALRSGPKTVRELVRGGSGPS
jgi:predicted Rossmann fold nucleotide-binding protein DprA/Smf involved in DNA uptake